jgi:hypothetical protein
MSKNSEKVKTWRRRTKSRIVEAMGGACCICGYNKCTSALALHHLDPSKKDFALSSLRANPKRWQTVVAELEKCILVCHNCHNEIHEGMTSIPNDVTMFNKKYADYSLIEKSSEDILTPCSVCGKLKAAYLKTCSRECSGKSQYKVDWDSIDLEKELKSKSIIELADELGCSDGAIHKRLKKIGLKK